ncbi:MAG TPA: hypothetical protein VHV78_02535, partial [Gemmatimonadaceae bacterium]|nr:hypothetical protein [Gemmatimonadaceae bacterium]
DSMVYEETLTLPDAFDNLAIQAADFQRPTIVVATGDSVFEGTPVGSQLVLSGLLFTSTNGTLVVPGAIDTIQFVDCTVDPGGGVSSDGHTARPAGLTIQMARANAGGTISFTRCITGPIDAESPGHPTRVLDCIRITDSIVDAQAFGAGAHAVANATRLLVQRSTLLGEVQCNVLETDLSIVDGTTRVKFRQQGCVRFSYFAPRSQTPRRYECAPSMPRPVYTSRRFGDPGYTQLALDCQIAVRTGERGYEMGVWSSLRNIQRQNHLELRLQDYMPAGLVPEIIFAT